MDAKLVKKIKELQEAETPDIETKRDVINKIIKKTKDLGVEEIRELLNHKTIVHSVVIQKGGVGKSTLTSDMLYTLANLGYEVLGIDTDPQGSLTGLCNIDVEDENLIGLSNIYDAFEEAQEARQRIKYADIEKAIVRPTFKTVGRNEDGKWATFEKEFGFDFIPCNIDLADYDILFSHGGKAFVLLEIIREILINKHYDFILIDCPPGLNALSYLAITAAGATFDDIDSELCKGITGGVITPLNLEPMTVRGATNLINTVSDIQQILDKKGIIHKGVVGVVRNQFSVRQVVQKELGDVVQEMFPVPVFETSLPSRTSCNKAHYEGKMFSQFDKKVGEILVDLCHEIIAEDIRRINETKTYFVDEVFADGKKK